MRRGVAERCRGVNSKEFITTCKIKTFVSRRKKLLEFHPSNREVTSFHEWYEANFHLEHFYRAGKKVINPDVNTKAIYNVSNLRFDKYDSCPLPIGEIEASYTRMDNGNIVNNLDSCIHFFMKHKAYLAMIDILDDRLYVDRIRRTLTIITGYDFFESESLTSVIINRFYRDRRYVEELRVVRCILEEKNLAQYFFSESYSSSEESCEDY